MLNSLNPILTSIYIYTIIIILYNYMEDWWRNAGCRGLVELAWCAAVWLLFEQRHGADMVLLRVLDSALTLP